jgi:hypothetical protein
MTPDPSFVADLQAYDPTLRVRWARHRACWSIEKRVRERMPDYLAMEPNHIGRSDAAKDLWESFIDGYLVVLSVHRTLLHWRLVAPELHKFDMHAAGGVEAINRALDAEAEAKEAAADRAVDRFVEAGSRDLHDRIAWDDGRRVSGYDPDPYAHFEQADGFKIYDRRGKA